MEMKASKNQIYAKHNIKHGDKITDDCFTEPTTALFLGTQDPLWLWLVQ